MLTPQLGAKQCSCCLYENLNNAVAGLAAVSISCGSDAGDVQKVKQYKPTDCTTNPSLVLKAVQMPEYEHYLQDAINEEKAAKPEDKYIDEKRPFAGARRLCARTDRAAHSACAARLRRIEKARGTSREGRTRGTAKQDAQRNSTLAQHAASSRPLPDTC